MKGVIVQVYPLRYNSFVALLVITDVQYILPSIAEIKCGNLSVKQVYYAVAFFIHRNRIKETI